MTVGDLIRHLQPLDPDLEVVTTQTEMGIYRDYALSNGVADEINEVQLVTLVSGQQIVELQ